MYAHEIEIRVRYGEVDMMGYLYYGYYSFYYEQARVETMRSLGISYKRMEELGYLLPVRDLHIKFIKPAYYDDVVRIRTMILKMPTTRHEFHYEMFNPQGELINQARTTLVYLDKATRRPLECPQFIKDLLRPYLSE
ncbi:MAG: acyl-CoA thioesterase [Chitinophagales bacterium]|nr:acyl-CoA thioesterase [Chitinophagales bacterium]MDW8428183.1 thioesterase family protein [Chitinophagales bacterium]